MVLFDIDDGNIEDGIWYYKIKDCNPEEMKEDFPADAYNAPNHGCCLRMIFEYT
jgi:hypothetical protein